MNDWKELEREAVLKKAKSLDLLNAVFLITHHNARMRPSWGDEYSIDAHSEFGYISKGDLKAALESSARMLLYSPYVGAAYYKYPTAIEFDAAIEKLKRDNPRYNEECYELAIQKSISDMR